MRFMVEIFSKEKNLEKILYVLVDFVKTFLYF
jgi:hypothetical protein